MTARYSDSEPMRTWRHEWLLGRPQKEDSLLGRRRDVQGSGGPYLLREPLLGQAIRRQGQKGTIFAPEVEARICCEHRSHDETLGKSLDDVPRHSPLRPYQEKGGRAATERDEVLRAAWRVTVAAVVEPERLVFVDECVLRTPHWHRSTATRQGASDCAFRCRGGGARTRRCLRA